MDPTEALAQALVLANSPRTPVTTPDGVAPSPSSTIEKMDTSTAPDQPQPLSKDMMEVAVPSGGSSSGGGAVGGGTKRNSSDMDTTPTSMDVTAKGDHDSPSVDAGTHNDGVVPMEAVVEGLSSDVFQSLVETACETGSEFSDVIRYLQHGFQSPEVLNASFQPPPAPLVVQEQSSTEDSSPRDEPASHDKIQLNIEAVAAFYNRVAEADEIFKLRQAERPITQSGSSSSSSSSSSTSSTSSKWVNRLAAVGRALADGWKNRNGGADKATGNMDDGLLGVLRRAQETLAKQLKDRPVDEVETSTLVQYLILFENPDLMDPSYEAMMQVSERECIGGEREERSGRSSYRTHESRTFAEPICRHGEAPTLFQGQD